MSKYAVVTGASSGIGLEMTKILAAMGYNLFIVARRKDRLDKIAEKIEAHYNVKCETMKADLSKISGCDELYDRIKDLSVEIFINNAGFGKCGPFLKTELSVEMDMLDLNCRAMHYLFKKMTRKMYNEREAYIMNVGSSAGLLPGGPYMATYYASKAYVTSLTQAVNSELKDINSGLKVSCLCPGPVQTEFNEVADVEFALPGISARDCALIALTEMFKGKCVIVPKLYMKAAVIGGRLLPRKLLVDMTGRQQKKKINR